MKSSKSIQTLIFFIIVALAGVAMNVVAFFYIKTLNARLSETQAENQLNEKRNFELFGSGEDNEDGAEAQILKLSSHVVDEDTAVALIEKIENDARAQGLNFEINSVSIDPSTPENDAALTERIRLRFEASASWQLLNHFIFYLEHMPYRTILENIELSRTEGTEAEWRLRAEVVILKLK